MITSEELKNKLSDEQFKEIREFAIGRFSTDDHEAAATTWAALAKVAEIPEAEKMSPQDIVGAACRQIQIMREPAASRFLG